MKMPKNIAHELLAPCGIDCMLCHHHCESEDPCGGCRGGKGKSQHCKNCELMLCAGKRGCEFCAECDEFPCDKLRGFNDFYIMRYGHEFLPNAILMKEQGERTMTEKLLKNWSCPDCGGVICIHDDTCSECGKKYKFTAGKPGRAEEV